MLFERVLSACSKSVSLAVAALVLAFSCGQAVTASAGEMTVSAAASLTNAFAELKTAFEKSHQGLTVHTNFAASNPLLKQMQEGAPVDVFASADQETMDKAQKARLIKPESRRNFVSNTVVLIVPAQGKKFDSLADLTKARRIAVGSPESVPVGRYTRDALKSAGRPSSPPSSTATACGRSWITWPVVKSMPASSTPPMPGSAPTRSMSA